MQVNPEGLVCDLLSVSSGLSKKGGIEQSDHYVFRDGKVWTFNDVVAASKGLDLGFEGGVVAEPLMKLLSKLSGEEIIDIEADGGELKISAGKRKRSGIRMDAKITLPIGSVEEPDEWHDLPDGFEDALRIVCNCASTDQSKFALSCVHIMPKYVEACDNLQIARHDIKWGFDGDVLLRATSLDGVLGAGITQYATTTNWMCFRNAYDLTIYCRIYSQKYEDFDKFVATDGEGANTELPQDMIPAIEKASIFAGNSTDMMVSVALRAKHGGKLRLRGQGNDGWYDEVFDIKYKGEDVAFRIQPDLLLELLKQGGDVKILPGRLVADMGNWRYVACTASGTEKDS